MSGSGEKEQKVEIFKAQVKKLKDFGNENILQNSCTDKASILDHMFQGEVFVLSFRVSCYFFVIDRIFAPTCGQS
jgi:hypothetical protein